MTTVSEFVDIFVLARDRRNCHTQIPVPHVSSYSTGNRSLLFGHRTRRVMRYALLLSSLRLKQSNKLPKSLLPVEENNHGDEDGTP